MSLESIHGAHFLLSATMKNRCLKNLSFLLNSLSISYFALLLFIAPSVQSAAVKSLSLSIPTHQPFDLMLVGGGMKTCSSQAPVNCQSEAKFSADAKRETRYVFNVSWLERALKHPRLQSLNEQQKRYYGKRLKRFLQSVIVLKIAMLKLAVRLAFYIVTA